MWWHTVTHARGSEGETVEWSGWPVLFTLPRNMVYPALLPLMRTPRLSVVDWTDTPADLNGLVRFAERRNLVSARVPSHFKSSRNWSFPKLERLGLRLTNWLYLPSRLRMGLLIYPLPCMPSPLGRRQLSSEVQDFLNLNLTLKASTRNPFKQNRLACLLYQVSYPRECSWPAQRGRAPYPSWHSVADKTCMYTS